MILHLELMIFMLQLLIPVFDRVDLMLFLLLIINIGQFHILHLILIIELYLFELLLFMYNLLECSLLYGFELVLILL